MDTPSIKDLTLVKKIDIINAREQIQEDIISYLDSTPSVPSWPKGLWAEELCQIVVDNFKKLK